MNLTKAFIHTDGAARSNPGPAAIGVIIKNDQNQVVAQISQRIGSTTNNQAEYRALIAALQKALSLGYRQVEIRSDSELMVRQLNGAYRVRNAALKPLFAQVQQLRRQFASFTAAIVPREQNRAADRLANRALDSD